MLVLFLAWSVKREWIRIHFKNGSCESSFIVLIARGAGGRRADVISYGAEQQHSS